MSTDAAAPAAYRGFLFCDLRGFTVFVERYGNASAAEMLRRFLALVREAVTRHDGAEVKTEGDSVHAVFPSASSAVMCGLAITEAAADANARDPDRPIHVGVGIHAGEAVETADGFIGTAVNIAARVCAVARPGEVLVTATVRGITQASIQVSFVPRGRQRLKGINEPVEVFAVTRGAVSSVRNEVPRWAAIGALLAAIALIAAASALGAGLLGGPGATASAPASSPALLADPGPLEIGTYVAQEFDPSFRFVVEDPGWTLRRNSASAVGLLRELDPRGYLDALRVTALLTEPCMPDGPTAPVGVTSRDLIEALDGLAFVEVSELQTVQLGNGTGVSVDATVDEGAQAACGGFAGGEVAIFQVADEAWLASPGERFRLVAIDAGGQTVAFVLSGQPSDTGSVNELQRFLTAGERIVRSVAF